MSASYEVRGDVAVITLDNPPVNAISPGVIAQLGVALDAFLADAGARALVVACAGRTFVAGGDLMTFDCTARRSAAGSSSRSRATGASAHPERSSDFLKCTGRSPCRRASRPACWLCS